MIIWSLFDGSGIAAQPWAERGCTVYCFNADTGDHGGYEAVRVNHPNIHYVNAWIDSGFCPENPAPDFIIAFPPCTDIAVSGAPHFASKRERDPNFQINAVKTARVAATLADHYEVPYMIENPVSVLASQWRKPDYTFQPWQYGGYLPEDDTHPYFPEYIKANDAYPKTTCLWVGNGFVMPDQRPVEVLAGYSDQHKKLGGKSARTKLIRSLTPRGFALAVCLANIK